MTRTSLALLGLLAACGGAKKAAPATEPPWHERYDFTGDGTPDHVEMTFTGGAHCCYLLAVRDGATEQRRELPFELDGGYLGGLDLSRPERFDIATEPSGLAFFRLRVATFDGAPEPLPADGWGLGITSHRIELRFDEGLAHPRVRNLGWSCDEAMTALRNETWAAWEGLPPHCTLDDVLDALDAVAGEGRAHKTANGETRLLRTAVRAADDSALELHLAPTTHPAARPELPIVRLDWLDPARALAAQAAWQPFPSETLADLRRWPCGLAIAPATGPPARLILLPRPPPPR